MPRKGKGPAKARTSNGAQAAQPGEPRIEYVEIGQLKPFPGNPKNHSLEFLGEAFAANGFAEPIIVDEGSGKIVAGHGRLEKLHEMQAAGAEPPDRVKAENGKWLVPVIRGMTFKAPEKHVVASNRGVELGGWDNQLLSVLLSGLGEENLAGTGFDKAALLNIKSDAALEAAEEAGEEEKFVESVFTIDDVAKAAFAYFRKAGFPYPNLPLHMCMQEVNRLAEMEPRGLIRTTIGYRVADTYHPHRLEGHGVKMLSPAQAFEVDKLLDKAIRMNLEYEMPITRDYWGMLGQISGTQSNANFRPGFAAHLYRQFCRPGDTVLDTSTGYGGRLVGYIASKIGGTYVGIDPSTKTYAGNQRLAADLRASVKLINKPAEDTWPDEIGPGSCAFAFTSPPYFAAEVYADEDTQSSARYKTPEEWRVGFLRPMLALQFACLKPGAYSAINIAPVTMKSDDVIPLDDWTRDDGIAAGFEYERTDAFPMTQAPGANRRGNENKRNEPIIILRKP